MKVISVSVMRVPIRCSSCCCLGITTSNWSQRDLQRMKCASYEPGSMGRTGSAVSLRWRWFRKPGSASTTSAPWTIEHAHHESAMNKSPVSHPMSFSRGEISVLIMPHMANILGDLFGGNLMALVDQAGGIAAIRHAGARGVTASIHEGDFRERIPIGSLVTCRSTVDFVGRSSMDITVEVFCE